VPPVTLSTRRALAAALGVLALVVLAGRHFADAGTTSATARPTGLYRLEDGTRIADAVRRAGGATRTADLTLVNLAAPVADGTQVVVPQRVETSGARGSPANGAPAAGTKLSLGRATAEELDALPGIGPATAQKIVAYRQEHGAIASVDELDAVPGIGPARLADLKPLVEL
jgi:competence protein ComEA